MIMRFAAAGLDMKIYNDIAWDLQRSDTQQLLDSTKSKSFSMGDVVERKLNLADTEGMFLLMAIGYILAGSVLFSEIVGGCAKSCRAFLRRNSGIDDSQSNVFSPSHVEEMEPKTFSDKLKRSVRRSLRSKPKPKPLEVENPKNSDEQEKTENASGGEQSEIKGPTSFCTLKRIMLMRKKRRDQKKAKNIENDSTVDNITHEGKEGSSKNNIESQLNCVEGTERVEHIIIENEKNAETGDAISLIESSSVYSDTHIIREETAVEVNELCVSDRENNPSKEFGEIV